MTADNGRPIGHHDAEPDEWLSRYNNEYEIQQAIANCNAWVLTMAMRDDHEEREQGMHHWMHRIKLLKAKALLMGISLEE